MEQKNNKNILIRNLTDNQNKRLLQLQAKFGVKTNSQALLMLLQYCVITDDEISTLRELYEQFGIIAFAGMKMLEQHEQKEEFSQMQGLVHRSIQITQKLDYLLTLRK